MEGPSTRRATLLAVCVVGVLGVCALGADTAPRVLTDCSNRPSYNFNDGKWSRGFQLRSNAPPKEDTFNWHRDSSFPDGYDLILACGLHGTGQLARDTRPFDVQFHINGDVIEPRGNGCITAVNTSTGWFSTLYIKAADPSYYGQFYCLASPLKKPRRSHWARLTHSRPPNTEFYPNKPQRLYTARYGEPLMVTCHSEQNINEYYVHREVGMWKDGRIGTWLDCTLNTNGDQWQSAGINMRQFLFRPTDIHTSGNWHCYTWPREGYSHDEAADAYFQIQLEEQPPTFTTIQTTTQLGDRVTVECLPQNITYPHPRMHLEWYRQGERMGNIAGQASEVDRRITKTFALDLTNSQSGAGYLSAGMELRCIAENGLGTASSTLSFQPANRTIAPTQSLLPTAPSVLGQRGQHLCNTAAHSVVNGRFRPVGEKRTIDGSLWSERFRVVCKGGFRVSRGRYSKTCLGSGFPAVPTCEPFTCRVNASEFSQSVKKSLCNHEWSVGGQFRGGNSTHIRVDIQYVCSANASARQHLLQIGQLPQNIQGCLKVNRQKKKLSIRLVGQSCSRWDCADQMIQNKHYFMSGLVHSTSQTATELVMSRDDYVLRWCNRKGIENIALNPEC